MKLYRISQNENDGYDTYDSAVVCAPDAQSARGIHPGGDWECNSAWCDKPELVRVEYIGEARDGMPAGIVCASFNAG